MVSVSEAILEGVLQVEKLGKRYGSRWLFRDLTFDLGIGDRLIVLGQNGAGKSTLLKIVAGLLPPSSGRARFEGDPRTTLGMATLDMSLYPALTVREHLEFSGRLRSCPDRSDELLERIGLQDASELATSQISTGMRARVKLAMAIQANPTILVLDEPGAGLDEKGRQLVAEIVKEQAQRGCLLLATNDPLERRLGTHELDLAL